MFEVRKTKIVMYVDERIVLKAIENYREAGIDLQTCLENIIYEIYHNGIYNIKF